MLKKPNPKKLAAKIFKAAIKCVAGGGTSYACYTKVGMSEDESVLAGIGAYALSGIALNKLIPTDEDDLYRKVKRCKSFEDVEKLVDELNDDEEDEEDDEEEDAEVEDSTEASIISGPDGSGDPTEETILSEAGSEMAELAESFAAQLDKELDKILVEKQINEISESEQEDSRGFKILDNGIHWRVSKKKEKGARRNNRLHKEYLEKRNEELRKEFTSYNTKAI